VFIIKFYTEVMITHPNFRSTLKQRKYLGYILLTAKVAR